MIKMNRVLKSEKNKAPDNQGLYWLNAEREGFEPPVHHCTMVFKTTAFDRSAISPLGTANVKIFLK